MKPKFSLLFIFVSIFLLGYLCNSSNTTINIGAIFNSTDTHFEKILNYTLRRKNVFNYEDFNRVNTRRAKPQFIKFTYDYQKIDNVDDSFKTGEIACELIENGVSVIIGPDSEANIGIVESVCSTMEIPHIQIHWNPTDIPSTSTSVLNIHPDPRALSKALSELVKALHWTKYIVLYEHDDALIRLQDILKLTTKDSEPVTVIQLKDNRNDTKELLKKVALSTINNVILDCDTERIIEILHDAKELGFLAQYQCFLLTNLDAHTLPFGDLFDQTPNITTVRLVDPNSREVEEVIRDWETYDQYDSTGEKMTFNANNISLKTALLYDAISLFADSVKDLHAAKPIHQKKFSCDNEAPDTWVHGLRITEYMKVKHFPGGLTGQIKFDAIGRRSEFDLQVVELSPKDNVLSGTLSAQHGFQSLRSEMQLSQQIAESIQKKKFMVASRIGLPYFDRKNISEETHTQETEFKGYAVDLIDGIASILNFTYKFYKVDDDNYGSYNKDKKDWNGLIKDLLIRKADLAICDLTITYERRSAVDFTMPFMTLGISILHSKPPKRSSNLFQFTKPFSTDVWLYMATAFLGVSFLMFILARMAPSDWENPHPCNDTPEEYENVWNFKNCLWFSLGSIMAQGCDILPKGLSTRMLSGMWWFFSLILLSSYTANLAAFLTMDRMGSTIESAEDLAKQSKVKYGAVEGGSTLQFFKNSNFTTYQRMWAAMESARPSVFTKSNQKGVARVINEIKNDNGYAFLMESTSIEYEVERNCDLVQVGGLLDSKGYGIAMPVNSPYRTAISGAVLKMQEDGTLHQLKEKWWKVKDKPQCDNEEEQGNANELGMHNVGGVFIVLAAGVSIAFVIAILEFLWNVRKVAVDEQMTLLEAFIVELKFAMNIFITKKSAKPKLSEPSSDNGSETRSIAQSVLRQAGSFLHINVFGNDISNNGNNNKK